jgi:two-component system chemotaxis response regulator CheY
MSKVLVIDDSKFSRHRAVEALRHAGHEVVEASDGEMGIAVLGKEAPDCVVLDMLMPVLDGIGFLRRIRDEGMRLPVIVVTADIQESTRNLCEGLGISGFLHKPARGEEVCGVVGKALQNREVQ